MSTPHSAALSLLLAMPLAVMPAALAGAHDDSTCGVLHFERSSSLRIRRVSALHGQALVRAATPPVVGVALDSAVASQFDLSPEWLEHTLRERAARMQSSGSMSDCPFAVDGVQVSVFRTATGLRVELRAPGTDSGREVLRRAEAMFHSS